MKKFKNDLGVPLHPNGKTSNVNKTELDKLKDQAKEKANPK
jgi:hypothetical protein